MKRRTNPTTDISSGPARVRVLAVGLAAKILYAGILLVVMPGVLEGQAFADPRAAVLPVLGVALAPLVAMSVHRLRLLYAGLFMLGEAICLGILPLAASPGVVSAVLVVLVALWMSSGLLMGVQLVDELTMDTDEQITELVEVMVPALLGGVLAAAMAVTSDEAGHQVAMAAAVLCGLTVLAVRRGAGHLAPVAKAHE